MTVERVYLVGLSGSGKSTVGRLLAERLGWRFLDTDRLLEERAGRAIPEVMHHDGEDAFRDAESAALREAASYGKAVIATGGGIVLREENQAFLFADSAATAVWLQGSVDTLNERLQMGPGTEERPLLRGDTPARLRAMLAVRERYYALAKLAIDTTSLNPAEVAAFLASALSPRPDVDVPAATVRTPGGSYDVHAAPGLLASLGSRLRGLGLAGRVFVVADRAVAALHGDKLAASLGAAGLEAAFIDEDLREETKNLDTASRIFDRMVELKGERKEPIVAFGGGVATDLGGFVAATYLRGVPVVHVPTTLLGMVDAAIGGKVAVDHQRGKNLIGAFYQPSLVLCDTALLATLPDRQFRSGFAEVLKHAFALDTALIPRLERDAEALLAQEPAVLARVVARSVATKARVVSADEREGGLRSMLNYGHTLGHALEAVTNYAGPLHGEAVSAGMMAAARISQELGLLAEAEVKRQEALLRQYRLPVRFPQVDVDALLAATLSDKKVVAGKVRWVLLEGFGRPVLRDDVPDALVRRVVHELVNAA
jgi:3-dehydroquinate synthase